MNIIVKKYEHFNTALPNWNSPKGVYVKSKEHYEKLCRDAGMVQAEKTGEISKGGSSRREYVQSNKAKEIIRSASSSKDKNGNVKLSDRTIDAMKSIGAIKPKADWNKYLPSQYTKTGGFK